MRREAHVRFLGGDPSRGGPLPDYRGGEDLLVELLRILEKGVATENAG